MGEVVLKYCGNKHFKTKIRSQVKKLKEAIMDCPDKSTTEKMNTIPAIPESGSKQLEEIFEETTPTETMATTTSTSFV